MLQNITNTQAAAHIPKVWSANITREFEANLCLGKLVASYDADAKGFGDSIQVPRISNFDAVDKIPNTQVVTQAITEPYVTISLNKYKHVAFLLEDITAKQSKTMLITEYSKKAAYGVRRAYEGSIASQATGFSVSKGTYNTALTNAVLIDSQQSLNDNDVPQRDRFLVIKPHALADLQALTEYMDFQKIGLAGNYATGGVGQSTGIGEDGFVGMLGGAKVYMSTIIEQAGNNISNIYAHREAIGVARQTGVKVTHSYENRDQGELFVASILYGVAEIRDEAGLELRN